MSRDIQLNPVRPSLTHPEHENTNSTLENVNVTLPSVIFALRLNIDSPLSVSSTILHKVPSVMFYILRPSFHPGVVESSWIIAAFCFKRD